MDREPLEPVGLGVGLKCGVVARPALPLPPESLLFWPVRSCDKTITSLIPQTMFTYLRKKFLLFNVLCYSSKVFSELWLPALYSRENRY